MSTKPPPLTSISTTAPVTALCFLGRHILAGSATDLHVFTRTSLLHTKRVFTRDRIHGILSSPDCSHTLLWGGRTLALAPTSDIISPTAPINAIPAPDWILTAAFWGDGAIAVGAHNELMLFERGAWTVIGVAGGERTMLYAADVAVAADGSAVTVAAGTVFGEIVVWAWRRGDAAGSVTRRLRGHEGSVFAVRFDRGGRWLASTSDDRTVRVWDLGAAARTQDGAGSLMTGMGEVRDGDVCMGLGWGHQARPWTVRFLPEVEGKVRLVTSGEDLSVRFWSVVPRPGETAVLENDRTWMLHQGKSIWCFALKEEEELMVTGGNDGRIGLLDYGEGVERCEEWAFEDVVPPVAEEEKEEDSDEKDAEMASEKLEAGTEGQAKVVKRKKKKNKLKDGFKSYAIVDQDRLAATTVFGQVLLYNMTDRTWKTLGTWEAMKTWSVIEAWEGTGILAIGDLEGKLGIVDVGSGASWWWEAGGRGKVADIFTVRKNGGVFSSLGGPFSQPVVEPNRLLSTRHDGRGIVNTNSALF